MLHSRTQWASPSSCQWWRSHRRWRWRDRWRKATGDEWGTETKYNQEETRVVFAAGTWDRAKRVL